VYVIIANRREGVCFHLFLTSKNEASLTFPSLYQGQNAAGTHWDILEKI
jgi:hypothetical protein